VVSLAQEEAGRLRHSVVEPEHLLLGIVREGEGVASRTLESLGIRPERIRAEIEGAVGRGNGVPPQEVGITPRAKKVLELASGEARRLGHNYIGTEHLLLGLIREGESVAARVLEAMGADLDRARAQVLYLLGEEGTMPAAIRGNSMQDTGAATDASVEAEVARLTEESQRNFQQFLRAAADLENYKKQASRQRDEAVASTRRAMVTVILTVADTLERALDHANASGDGSAAAILEGIRLAHRQVLDTLKSVGVRPMESVGQPFDPRVHDAVAAVAAPEGVERGMIVDEVQRGYLIGDDVLRPARVRVAQ
jgi:molecular chaperone GrpE (heat shock protein)